MENVKARVAMAMEFQSAVFEAILSEAKFSGDGKSRLSMIIEPRFRQEVKGLVDAYGITLRVTVERLEL